MSVENVQSYKYRGIYLDNTLNFVDDIDYVAKKVAQRLGIISLSRKYMSSEHCITLFLSLVLPLKD